MKETILKSVRLGPQHQQPGRTEHYANGSQLGPFVKLAIADFGDGVYYLYYYDNEDGDETTDTLHDSVEAAMAQAEFEFGVKPEEWRDLD